jgi:hypothetical protein
MLETALVLILLESPFIVALAGCSFVRRQLIPSGAFLLGAIALVTVTVREDAQHYSHRGKESGFDALPLLYFEIPIVVLMTIVLVGVGFMQQEFRRRPGA